MVMDEQDASELDLDLAELRVYAENVMKLLEQRLSQMTEGDLSVRITDLYARDSRLGTARSRI